MEANIVKSKHSSYNTRTDDFGNLWVSNVENTLFYAPANHTKYQIDDKFEFQSTANAFGQALGLERLQELEDKKERLSTSFWLSSDGKIKEVDFLTAADSTIDINEFEAMETALKSTLSFNITWLEEPSNSDFSGISRSVSFELIMKILKGHHIFQTKITQVTLSPPPLK